MEWTLEEIRAKVRDLTGRPLENQLSTAKLDKYINNYYQLTLPDEIGLVDLDTWYDLETEANVGEYSLDPTVFKIGPPITIDGTPIVISFDPSYFFGLFPRDQESTALKETSTHCLFYDKLIYLRPIPDKIYELKATASKRPDALVETTDTPKDSKWGPLIAYGAAIDIFQDNGEDAEAQAKQPTYNSLRNSVTRKQVYPLLDQRAVPRW